MAERDEREPRARLGPREILRQAGLSPKRSFGQNFLTDPNVTRLIATVCVRDGEEARTEVVELGAGTGALTQALLARSKRVVAVERDRDLVPILNDVFADEVASGQLEIAEADAQAVTMAGLLPPRENKDETTIRVLCGNLPYQITGRLLQRAVEQADDLDRVVFMVQKEVADRLIAKPGSKEYGALTVFTRAAFDVKRAMTVSRHSFLPPPDVTSAVIELTPVRPPRARETDMFRALVKAAFGMRRKTLRNCWTELAGDRLVDAAATAGISLDLRGETLDVTDFARMAKAMET